MVGNVGESVFKILSWLSWFRNAIESMIINEMHGLLIEDPDIKLKVPADFILDRFGFRVGVYWQDILMMTLMISCCLLMGYMWLKYKVK